ncbi:hypothetical protein HELRODRAFT_114712 [Helobdella robusta]|uniref:CID domain-containing protein n=1 Tax=Helobdella robusta TaxID=6412 RepID=T1EG42_HELRO|nr:hypothetical protein HELRODRAFT_114712 [Helobdella robusta]ESN95586.1 hypothetical protein HELRODRAFT_114712 [Helobdella robusta]
MADEEESCIMEYRYTLEDLTFNSKPHINALTMLAEENKHLAANIVKAVENRIKTAIPTQKLPAIYLMDSIIKNIPDSDYLKLFKKNLPLTFVMIFEKVDEKTRAALYKLRLTWVNLFPNETLLSLDIAIKSIDPAWPITARQPGDPAPQPKPSAIKQQTSAFLTRAKVNNGSEASDFIEQWLLSWFYFS